MFEQIKLEIENTPVKLEYLNGKVKFGVIINYIEKEINEIKNWKFVSFNNLPAYNITENPALIENLEKEKIVSIDMMLK